MMNNYDDLYEDDELEETEETYKGFRGYRGYHGYNRDAKSDKEENRFANSPIGRSIIEHEKKYGETKIDLAELDKTLADYVPKGKAKESWVCRLESYLIPTMESDSALLSDFKDIAFKVPVYFNSTNAKIKSTTLPGKLIYFDELMKICSEKNISSNDFTKFIETYGQSINTSERYFLDRGLIKGLDLIYVGTHQNAGIDIFYSKSKKAFITISDDSTISKISNKEFISWQDAVDGF